MSTSATTTERVSRAPHARPGMRGLFARVLHRRGWVRHYRRLPWWGHRVGGESHRHAQGQVAQAMRAAAATEPAILLARLHSSPEGLDAARAARLRGRVGDRKSTRLNSSHSQQSRMPSSA